MHLQIQSKPRSYRQWVLNIAVAVFVNRHAGGAVKTLLTEVRDPGAFARAGILGAIRWFMGW